MTNQKIAEVLEEISQYLKIENEPFKPRAYAKAAEVITGLDEEVVVIYKRGGLKTLKDIPGVGESIAEKIEELIKTGRLKYYEQLKKELPVDLSELTSVEGVGPKQAAILYKKLKIKNLKQLEKAAQSNKISKLEGFGEKREANMLKSIQFLKESGGRLLLHIALDQARLIEERLSKLRGVKKAVIAGSLRRRKETIGDIDILAVAEKAAAKRLADFFTSMPEVEAVFAKGSTKTMIRLKNGIDADLRIVPEKSFGAALHYFTGSKEHNIALRELAVKKGWKLNEYGLFKGKKFLAGRTEKEIYKALGINYIDPEMREMTGELKIKKLPNLIDYGDLRGDLQIQTNWSDGVDSIEAVAKEAGRLGLEYILITDHTKRLAMANGLDKKRLLKQMAEIDRINKKFQVSSFKFQVLKGTECDILKDGQMDLDDNILAKLDIVGGAVHSSFNLSEKEQTERIKKAMDNPNVDIIFHPTGRIINRRPAYKVDIDELIRHAKKTGTVLEINAFPDRLDLKDEYVRKCVESKVRMSISSDAHAASHLSVLEYGVAQARRGWATKEDIINAWPLKKMLGMLK